jgi:Domain of unknown function (DUF4158)
LPTIHDTAYPRLKSSVSEKELNEIYTPTADDFDLAHSLTHSTAMRIGFLVLLKTFQPPLHPMGGVRRTLVGRKRPR